MQKFRIIILVVCAGLVLLCEVAQAFTTPQLPSIPSGNFNVTKFGAVGDGVATNTAAIQAAIDAASAAGGGMVEISPGTFLSGPIHLASDINFHLDGGAELRMLPIDKYPGGTDFPDNFITGSELHDVAISGTGMINGQGIPWWPCAKTFGARRPIMIRLTSCTNVLFETVTLSNSPMFHIAVSGRMSNVTVRGLTIRANPSTDPVNPGHNTDACDVSGNDILIENCDISVGDDDFTCGGRTSNVLITNCTYGYGHGVSIGSPTAGGVSNIMVINCTFNNTEQGIRIKSARDRGGYIHNMQYINLSMTNVLCPILIYGTYENPDKRYRDLFKLTPEIAATYPTNPVVARTPIYRDFLFSNITATVQSNGCAGLIWGLPEMEVSNVVLQNVSITANRPFGIFDAQNIRLINTKITTPAGIDPLSVTNSQIDIVPE